MPLTFLAVLLASWGISFSMWLQFLQSLHSAAEQELALRFSHSHLQWSYPDNPNKNEWCGLDLEDSFQSSVPTSSWIYCKPRHENKNGDETLPCISRQMENPASFPQPCWVFLIFWLGNASLFSSKGGVCCSSLNLWRSWLCLSLLASKVRWDCSCISVVGFKKCWLKFSLLEAILPCSNPVTQFGLCLWTPYWICC